MTRPLPTPGALLVAVILFASLGCAATGPSEAPRQDSLADDVRNATRVAKVHVALLDQLGADALTVRAEVVADRATLRGDVEKRSTQELAEEIALSVAGIERVDNRIRYVDPTAGDESVLEQAARTTSDEVGDAALETRVNIKLLGELGRHALGLEVEATEGVVSLRGTVPDRERKRVALKATRSVSGVEKVIDLLETKDRR